MIALVIAVVAASALVTYWLRGIVVELAAIRDLLDTAPGALDDGDDARVTLPRVLSADDTVRMEPLRGES